MAKAKAKAATIDEVLAHIDGLNEHITRLDENVVENQRRLTRLQLHFDQFAGAQTTTEVLRELVANVDRQLSDSKALARQLAEGMAELMRRMEAFRG